jgi:hypothetical protein
VRDFARSGRCRVYFRWTITDHGVAVELATEEVEAHDVAIELLVCLGQVLWDDVTAAECDRFLRLLSRNWTRA